MSKQVTVLGCGLVGSTIVRDLASREGLAVAVIDLDPRNLDKLPADLPIKKTIGNVSDRAFLQAQITEADIVIGALPSRLGFAALQAVIEAGKHCVDISFMPEDATTLSELARSKGVTAVVDCGVAPGLSNLIVGHLHAMLDRTMDVSMFVGGLPKIRQWPYEYKAPFSPHDVIEEYTRPARLIDQGHIVTRPALSDPELIDMPQVGTLEAFNTDGLRSLLYTIKADNMREKTLRYPGHRQLIRVLRDSGFFDKRCVEIGGARIRPIDLTAELLFPLWALEEEEPEFTLLCVYVEGVKGQEHLRFCYELYDEYDREMGMSSMSRTTGFPAVIVALKILAGELHEAGVFPPELLVAQRRPILEEMLDELGRRGVMVQSEISDITDQTDDG